MTARLESLTLAVGLLLIALGAAFYDWRLGLVVAGAFLILSTVDLRGVRR